MFFHLAMIILFRPFLGASQSQWSLIFSIPPLIQLFPGLADFSNASLETYSIETREVYAQSNTQNVSIRGNIPIKADRINNAFEKRALSEEITFKDSSIASENFIEELNSEISALFPSAVIQSSPLASNNLSAEVTAQAKDFEETQEELEWQTWFEGKNNPVPLTPIKGVVPITTYQPEPSCYWSYTIEGIQCVPRGYLRHDRGPRINPYKTVAYDLNDGKRIMLNIHPPPAPSYEPSSKAEMSRSMADQPQTQEINEQQQQQLKLLPYTLEKCIRIYKHKPSMTTYCLRPGENRSLMRAKRTRLTHLTFPETDPEYHQWLSDVHKLRLSGNLRRPYDERAWYAFNAFYQNEEQLEQS